MLSLEFNKILAMLSDNAISEQARQKLKELRPYLSEREVTTKLKETTQARKILDTVGSAPLAVMKEVPMLLELSEKGAMLLPEQLTEINLFINACKRMKSFLKKAESLQVDIAAYGGSINELSGLSQEIELAIRNHIVDDGASKELKDIRRKMEQIRSDIRIKLESQLRGKKEWFTDSYVSTRNGHFVLPVKREFKHMVSGTVHDISSTGSTYFIEPVSVSKRKEELSLLEIEESNEERRILYVLSALVSENGVNIRLNIEAMETLDIIFAKAKLSLDMKAIPPEINSERAIKIVNGRHPLIKPAECIPLNFSIGGGVQGIIITGPNTGGKTVALKTIGLFQLMAQSGLHIPCEAADLCLNNVVLCDIGDGQSITENLSTFSSHITNIIGILNQSDQDSLVLLDELGSGTDPAEGMGIAISILEELKSKGCLFVATTHYPEVKDYAEHTEGLQNAKMAFDRETLKPLYRLEIGSAGESCALYIAKRLGLPSHMLERAYSEAYLREGALKHTPPDKDFLEEDSIPLPNGGLLKIIPAKIEKAAPKKPAGTRSQRFQIGDSVMVYPQKKIGIVFQPSDEKGLVGVQIQHKKEFINHKRLQLKVAASEMYPADYDFSIIFDSVANRKAKHRMDKGHQEDLQIVYEKLPSKN
ncbi:MAG TPA: DNA mismatch repair protein MutS [Clostridiales bacterium]|nr:DNA mismatch repair protein MutS [Clostridiales bacterium]